MKKVCCIIVSIILLSGVYMRSEKQYFIEQLNQVESVNVYIEGECIQISCGDSRFDDILTAFSEMMEGYREMPAFGVSLHEEVENAKENGLWVEFCYENIHIYEGMPYERLLIELKNGDLGFNIMRFYNGKYEGRCFYVDLKNDNQKFIATIEKVR